ncbi:MAG: hypothetical protein HOO88_06075 [Kiritimatiellaceae bacterium]|nr:hypothetical protein [Kiritimatiellaceae bacterium]
MRTKILCLSVVLVAACVSAAQFSDDFNRTSTPFVTQDEAAQIGEGWKTESPGGAWRILNQQLTSKVPAEIPKPIIYNTAMVTKPGNGSGFMLSGTVTMKTENRTALAGLVCNYQNSNEQYVFRYSAAGLVQFLRKNSADAVLNKVDAFKHVPGTAYRLTVLCEKPYAFKLTIQNAGTGETVFSQEVTDNKKVYTDGYGGFYSSCGAAIFDDISFEIIEVKPVI